MPTTLSNMFCIACLVMIQLFFMTSGEELCEPKCFVPNSKIIDPRDCSQFYLCSSDLTISPTPYRCPPGLDFNPMTQECDTNGCHFICGRCHLACDANIPNDRIADVFDCSVYYQCYDGNPTNEMRCDGQKPHFDGVRKDCFNNATACCNPGCDPHCEPGFVTVPDPTDCTKYYTCVNGLPDLHYSCPEGENFDVGSGVCKGSAKCIQWCNSDGGTTTTTTTTTPTPKPDGCISSLTCPEYGFYPRCPQACDPGYFYCPGPGYPGIPEICSDGMDFNPVPGNFYCINSGSCPYFPLQ